jgi:hypothetical protein
MQISVDISLYPLTADYLPAIGDFIRRVGRYPGVHIVRNDLSTQLFGDHDTLMELLKVELAHSWAQYGKGIFVIKFLAGDLRGLADDGIEPGA